MARMNPRVSQFRRSVVVTVTVAAASAALSCGLSDPEIITNPPGPEHLTSCPSERPAVGDACNPSETCDYDDCSSACEPCEVYSCVDRTWRIEVQHHSCNPPLPTFDCPSEPPEQGMGCDYEGPTCGYNDCMGEPSLTADCLGGAWQVGHMTCNPPEPECPEALPTAGDSCEHFGPSCTYGSCNDGPAATADCVNGSWKIETAECETPCPEQPPNAGSSCAHIGPTCEYGDCAGVPTTEFDCLNGKWQEATITCNPPPPMSDE